MSSAAVKSPSFYIYIKTLPGISKQYAHVIIETFAKGRYSLSFLNCTHLLMKHRSILSAPKINYSDDTGERTASLKKVQEHIFDRLAESCKCLSVNQMDTGLIGAFMDFFSFLHLFQACFT